MIKSFAGKSPSIHPNAYVADNSSIIGDVTLEEGSSCWYGSVLRGDFASIHIGRNTAVEDNVIIHGDVVIGENNIVGHGAILHSCIVGNNCLIGIGVIVLDRCVIGDNVVIAAGSLLVPGTVVAPNSMVMGSPAQVIKEISTEQKKYIADGVVSYLEFAREQFDEPKHNSKQT